MDNNNSPNPYSPHFNFISDKPKQNITTSQCGSNVKLLQVKKNGPNQGKWFYTCDNDDCNSFQWQHQLEKSNVLKCQPKLTNKSFHTNVSDFQSITNEMDIILENTEEILRLLRGNQ